MKASPTPGTVRLPRELWAALEALTRDVGAHSVRELVGAALELLVAKGRTGEALREAVRARLREGAGQKP